MQMGGLHPVPVSIAAVYAWPRCQRSVGGRCDAGGAPSSLCGWGAARRRICQAGYRRCR
ncbi:hypothetical protein K438DRAFT_1863802 [Mycena galopus ATCC 62051]|nr:hypothetical protein K438DRAFT_1863802 [Mycena galopus ATCC 62051]